MTTPLRTYYNGPRGPMYMVDHVNQQTRYFHYDTQGTVQCLTDGTGAVTDRFACDAWGVQVKRTGSSINRHWYIGRSGYYRGSAAPSLDLTPAGYLSNHLGRGLTAHPLPGEVLQAYNYAGNRPTRPGDAAPVIPTVSLAYTSRPSVASPCGGVIWIAAWTLRPPLQKVSGWVIQHVSVSGQVRSCDVPPGDLVPTFPTDFEYYEAWRVVDGLFSGGQAVDRFSLPAQQNPSQGSALITGYAKFIPDLGVVRFKSQGGTWMSKEQCDRLRTGWSINLPCSLEPPIGWSDDGAVHRHLSIAWECDPCGGCRCTHCGWAPRRRGDEGAACDPPGLCGK